MTHHSTTPTVAIVGRPNVGKSTLFNRLYGKQRALVAPEPGVTRDLRRVSCTFGGLTFDLLDTAGLEPREKGLAGQLNMVSEAGIKLADILLFVLDGRDGITGTDQDLARQLHKSGKKVICVVNKEDVGGSEQTHSAAYALGFGEPVFISAAHGRGLETLVEALEQYIAYPTVEELLTPEGVTTPPAKPLALAVIGRPNAGKSTLVNALLGEEKMLTGDLAGLTRESIGHVYEVNGQQIELIDTPGLRRKSKITEDLEQMSVGESLKAIDRAEAVLLVMDATRALEAQDVQLAEHVVKQGKILIVIANKSDLLENRDIFNTQVRKVLDTRLAQLKNVPALTLSASKKRGLQNILPTLFELREKWMQHIPTAHLNRFLEAALEQKAPPICSGRRLKIKFISQTGTCPPTFNLWCNLPSKVPTSYLRYLRNRLVETFGFEGVPVRLHTKGADNPYATRKKR